MSATLADADHDASLRDPYRLDHLAEELATRESTHHDVAHMMTDPVEKGNGELPEHIPLSHNDKYLAAEVFNVEDFLLARSHTSLPDLRAELRQYLASLKEELVQLINDDYEAFISLSTDLRNEGARLERLKYPLKGLKEIVLESKQGLQTIQNEIHDKLSKRGKLREEKALLHLLLKISDSVTRLESMLLITSPDTVGKDAIETGSNFLVYPSHNEEGNDEKFRTNRAKYLSRVSVEYTQLLYHARKARTDKCKFVDEIQWRIDRIQSTLSSDLDLLFTQTLNMLIDSKSENRGTELERTKWITDLTECLRTYDILGLWRDAEDIIRREAVRGFVKKTIYPGALTTPHSPLAPHTPFYFPNNQEPVTAALSGHQIPYTPFTAFIPKQIVRKTSGYPSDLPQAQLLDDTDDPLALLYNQLLRFVERDIGKIMDIAEKITVKPAESRNEEFPPNSNSAAGENSKAFQIMANVVWDEIGNAILDEIGGIVFSVGRPNEFRKFILLKHYETTQSFIRSLELLAPTMQAVESMRQHPTYLAFERRWQLPVYFQLRWKEIVGTLEEMLTTVRLEPIIPKDGSFALPQSSAVWIAVSACWSSQIYIPELSHRFWRLTLQILSRYKEWLEEIFASIETLSKGQHDKVTSATNPPRASTPAGDTLSSEAAANDDTALRYAAAAIVDIRLIERNVLTLWRQIIAMMMPDNTDLEFQTEDALRESISALAALIAPFSRRIIAILTHRCCDGLLPVRSIPSQFRAMSNKKTPMEPSYFVSSILRPLKQFFAIGTAEGPGSLLKEAYLKEYASEVFTNVTQRYISYLTAMKKIEEPLKRLRKNKKSTFSLFGNAATSTDEGKDEERIRSQMILDANAFGKDGESLRVEVETNSSFKILKDMVYATDPE